MRKLALLLCLVLLFGCSPQEENNSHLKNPEEIWKSITTKRAESGHQFSLEEHFIHSSVIGEKKLIPQQRIDEMEKLAAAKQDIPNIIFMQILARADNYTDEEIEAFIATMPDRFVKKDCQKEFDYFEVFQTIPNQENKTTSALARGVKKNNPSALGPIFLFTSKFRNPNTDENLYNGLKIEPKSTECIVYHGTFTYKDNDNNNKTGPTVYFLPQDQQIINPAFEKWARDLVAKHRKTL